jgi:hypothetical protein
MARTGNRAPAQEQRFSEGEPDLEPPEEMAVGELDADVELEEDLDCQLVDEDDVDTAVLQQTLEDLSHAADDEVEDPDLASDEFRCRACGLVRHRQRLARGGTDLCVDCSV